MSVPGAGAVAERLRVTNKEFSVFPTKYGKTLSVDPRGLRYLN